MSKSHAAEPVAHRAETGRLTPRAALAALLAIVGERAWSNAVRKGTGDALPGDLTASEVIDLLAWLRRAAPAARDDNRPARRTPRTLAAELLLIRIYLRESPTRAPGRRTGRPSRRAFNGAIRGALAKLRTLATKGDGRPERAPRALALLLLLRGLDVASVLMRRAGTTPAGVARVRWLVDRIDDFTKDRRGSGEDRRMNAARRAMPKPR